MKRRTVALLLLAGALTACHHKDRPPVLTSTPGGEGSGRTGSRDGVQPLDAGPDVRALPEETTSSRDFAVSDASGEGGPLADIHFEYDRATLNDEARATLEKHALWLQSHREAKVTIEGHCDERGTTDYNLAKMAEFHGVAWLARLPAARVYVPAEEAGSETPSLANGLTGPGRGVSGALVAVSTP